MFYSPRCKSKKTDTPRDVGKCGVNVDFEYF